jgi:uroporphyrin-3 C-methyltransferase
LQIARATIGAERTLPDKVAREPGERNWETLVEDLWAGFKDAVRIRERDQPVAAMLAPEDQFFLYENLKLHLEAARLNLARADQSEFSNNLLTAVDWIAKYFTADSVSQAITTTLAELAAIDIHPPLPDVSQSLRALTVRQQLIGDITPPETAAAGPAPTPATP